MLFRSDFASSTVRFVISRFDRFSRKYNVGCVTVSLAELEVDISRETFFTRAISPWRSTQVRKVAQKKLGETWVEKRPGRLVCIFTLKLLIELCNYPSYFVSIG